jgi:hypothetical protein
VKQKSEALCGISQAGTHNNHVVSRASGGAAGAAAYGKKFSQFGSGSSQPRVTIQSADVGGTLRRADFSQKYFAFYFLDASFLPHYGWTYGSLTGDYSDQMYNLISYAHDTTPGVMITTGQTQQSSSNPEPSTAALGAMAALIPGAAGVRKWNRARA